MIHLSFFLKLFLVVVVLVVNTSVNAAEGTHFIVLIDDSKNFKTHIKRIVETLPEVLFDGIQKQQGVGTAIPNYQSRKDYLSLGFFGLTKSPNTCIKNARLSLLPKHLFHWETVPYPLDKEQFRAFLQEVVKKKCRFTSFISPRATAESLILPFAQSQLSSQLFFAKTVLLLLSNDSFKTWRKPAQELESYLYQKVKNKGEALGLVEQVTKTFRPVRAQNGIFTVHNNNSSVLLPGGRKDNQKTLGKSAYPLVYRLTEFQPIFPNVNAYLEYPSEIKLDRVAVSQQNLRILAVGGQEASVLRIQAPGFLRPESMQLQFADQQGNTWYFGKQAFPQNQLIRFDNCEACIVQANSIRIPLFQVITPELSVTANDELLKPGTIRFAIRFRHETAGIYDHHFVDTNWQEIAITPIPPLTIPADSFFPKLVLDNQELAKQWTTNDIGGLNQKLARQRLETQRNHGWIIIVISTILTLIVTGTLLFWYLYRRYSKYPFEPTLQWIPESGIKLDFNQAPGTRLLAGMLIIQNQGRISPFWAKLFKPRQPLRYVKILLDENELKFLLNKYQFELDTKVFPLGFLKETGDASQLLYEIDQQVCNQTAIPVFLATEAVKDIKPVGTNEALPEIFPPPPLSYNGKSPSLLQRKVGEEFVVVSLPIKTSINMIWEAKKHDTGYANPLTQPIEFELELVPEKVMPPYVTYQPRIDSENAYFEHGKQVLVGTVSFECRVQRQFAIPFQEPFILLGYQGEHLPLALGTIVMEGGEQLNLLPEPNSSLKEIRQVFIHCDGKNVPNPIFPNQEYALRLLGNFAPESELGVHKFRLLRDPTKVNIILNIIQFTSTYYKIFWEQDGIARVQKIVPGKVKMATKLKSGILDLDPYPEVIGFDDNHKPSTVLFKIQVGNTAKYGEGWVRVAIDTKLVLKQGASSIILQEGCQLNETVITNTSTIEVKEGERSKVCVVQLNTALMKDIVEGRLDKQSAPIVVVTLDIKVVDDRGTEISRQLIIHNSIPLEKWPERNWLGIDLGTSAITAAIGVEDNISLLRLQKMVPGNDEQQNLLDYDPNNLEKDSEFLLPSYVACDADKRQGKSAGLSVRKGFPAYAPASLQIGEPDFVALPASLSGIQKNPERIIFALKSWLAQPSNTILLPEFVLYQQKDGHEINSQQLPLDEVVKSNLAALAEAYILALPETKLGQAIICYPNTFTPLHRHKLHTIAMEALEKHLKIPLPERIHLLSESEAVACYYCRQRWAKGDLPPDFERILVYDCGAGTVDLSVIEVRGHRQSIYPQSWQVKNSLGVPVAGNYLDSILARLIDEALTNSEVLNPNLFEYRYPIVSYRLRENQEYQHRLAILALWMAIKATKHQQTPAEIPRWGIPGNPFCVKVGNLSNDTGIVVSHKNTLSGHELDEAAFQFQEITTICLKFYETDIYLCIPAESVQYYKPMREFMEFITDTVLVELLGGAGFTEADIDTVVISGRGALWANLPERIWEKFPNANQPDEFLQNSQTAKEPVVRGAMAWQEWQPSILKNIQPPSARFGILLDNSKKLILEEEWQWNKTPIDLSANTTFSVVQIAMQKPNPNLDLAPHSLKRHFYLFLEKNIRRDLYWAKNPRLWVKKSGHKIILGNETQGEIYILVTPGSLTPAISKPDWPIGDILLYP